MVSAVHAHSSSPPVLKCAAPSRNPGRFRRLPASAPDAPPLPKTGGEEEASLLPSHFGRGGGLSSPPKNGRGGGPPFSQARIVPEHIVWGSLVGSARKAHGGRASGCGQGASFARRRSQALGGSQPWGVLILVPVSRRVETGPGCEASGGGGGRPRGNTLAVADGSHAFVRVAVRSLTVPRGAPRLDAWRRRRSERVNQKAGTRSGQARKAKAGGRRARARGAAWPPKKREGAGMRPGRRGRGPARRGRPRPGAGERAPAGATPHGQLGPRPGPRRATPRRGETRPGVRSRLRSAREPGVRPGRGARERASGPRRQTAPWRAGPGGCVRASDGTYLVDPASSHKLISKTKPCTCKHRPPHGEAANGSLDRLQFIRSYTVTWITVVILELIHATSAPTWQGGASLLDQNQPAREGRASW